MNRVLTFVRVDGRLIRVSVRGEGPPLLLIMGLGTQMLGWHDEFCAGAFRDVLPPIPHAPAV